MKITTNLFIGRIAIYPLEVIYCSLLEFVLKLNKIFHHIYNLFLFKPRLGFFVNAIILKAYSIFTYSTIDEILALILFARRRAVILKRNFKDTF